jgi:hypothetical protein
MEFVPVPGVLDDPSFLDGPKPLDERKLNIWEREIGNGVTHRATERASASASLILRISSARSSDVDFKSRLYQWISLFFCHRPVGALVLWPR